MKLVKLLVMFAIISIGCTSESIAGQARITIDQIIANDYVSGYVSGLAPAEYGKYKVIFYVHTDQWYIHPYAGQGEGMSWASIKGNSTWQIKTVQREFKANSIAALIVERQYPEPNKVEDIRKIPYRAIVVKELQQGSQDYGKL